MAALTYAAGWVAIRRAADGRDGFARVMLWVELAGVVVVGTLSLVAPRPVPRRLGVVGLRQRLRLRPGGAAGRRAAVAAAAAAAAGRAAPGVDRMTTTSTAFAVSPDSGAHWTEPGAWPVAAGIHRIPLPLPMDGLRAVNVYAIETDDGLTLVDGGWAIAEARTLLEQSLARDRARRSTTSRRFLVTHVHRDHYTQAAVIGRRVRRRTSASASATSRRSTCCTAPAGSTRTRRSPVLRAAGADELAARWQRHLRRAPPRPVACGATPTPGSRATTALDGRRPHPRRGRTPPATPRATTSSPTGPPGCSSPATTCCPRSRPSIGFEPVPGRASRSRDFLASLTKVRALPDLRLLPAHGPVAGVLARPGRRAARPPRPAARAVPRGARRRSAARRTTSPASCPGPGTSAAWPTSTSSTPRSRALETKAHLELLVARGQATRQDTPDGVRFTACS